MKSQNYASDPSVLSGEVLSHFTPVTEEQLRNVISRSKLTPACADPIATKIVMDCLCILIPVSLLIINTSVLKGTISKPLKCAVEKKRTWTKCGNKLLISVKLALYQAVGTCDCRSADGHLY